MKAGIGALLALCTLASAAAPLQVQAPSEVAALLGQHLDLARALGRETAAAPLDADERQRLCKLAPEQSRALLQTLGHFNPGAIELDCAAGRLTVDPGPRAVWRRIALQVTPPNPEPEQAAEPVREHGEGNVRRTPPWRDWLPLQPGDAFDQDGWASAKRALLSQARSRGHPLARWARTEATVDAEQNAVDAELELAPGPAVRLGAVSLQGLVHHDAERTRQLLGLREGSRYTEQRLLDAQERLLKSGLFDAVQVELEPEGLSGDRMPVRVRLREAPLQQVALGVGWQSNSGERATVEHVHRLPFGWPVRSRVKLAWGRLSQLAESEISTHPEARQRRELVGVAWQREDGTDAPFRQASLRLGQVFETRREDRSTVVEALTSQQGLGLQHRDARALLLHLNPTWRELDSVILPTRGQAWVVQSALGHARSRDALGTVTQGPLVRLQARWQGFFPLEGGRQWSLRADLGRLWTRGDALGLPESLRWRAGGDESVRGYSHRSLGPDVAGQAVGGTHLWTTSAEFTQPLPARWVGGLDGLGVAAFVDAGRAALSWRDAKPALGAGVGARWRSPVGLLRVDLARGQPRFEGGWRLHVSVGLAL